MTRIRTAVQKFRKANATDHIVTWFGVHITKIHIYGAVSGSLTLMDFAEGRHGYGLLVLVLAALDLSKEL